MKRIPGRDIPVFDADYRLQIRSAYWKLKTLTMPIPKRIMQILEDHPEGRNVTQLFIALRMDQSAVSQQLRLLSRCRLVNRRRDGKNIIYTSNTCRMAQIANALDKFFQRSSGEIVGVHWERTVV